MKLAPELGIDLGTANILVYRGDKGLVLNEPAVVAVHAQTGKVLKVGTEAYDMLGRAPNNILVIKPLKDGVIADYTTTLKMLQYVIEKACGKRGFFTPRSRIGGRRGLKTVGRGGVFKEAGAAGRESR